MDEGSVGNDSDIRSLLQNDDGLGATSQTTGSTGKYERYQVRWGDQNDSQIGVPDHPLPSGREILAGLPKVGAHGWSLGRHNKLAATAATAAIVGGMALGGWAGFVIGSALGPAGSFVGAAIGAAVGGGLSALGVLGIGWLIGKTAMWHAGLDKDMLAQQGEWSHDLGHGLRDLAEDGLAVGKAANDRRHALSRSDWNNLLYIPVDKVGSGTQRRLIRELLVLRVSTGAARAEDLQSLRRDLIAASAEGRLDAEAIRAAREDLRAIAADAERAEGIDDKVAHRRATFRLDLALHQLTRGERDIRGPSEALRFLDGRGLNVDDIARRYTTDELMQLLSPMTQLEREEDRSALRRILLARATRDESSLEGLTHLREALIAGFNQQTVSRIELRRIAILTAGAARQDPGSESASPQRNHHMGARTQEEVFFEDLRPAIEQALERAEAGHAYEREDSSDSSSGQASVQSSLAQDEED